MRYCPLCNRQTTVHRAVVGPFSVQTCSACGYVHGIRDVDDVHPVRGNTCTPGDDASPAGPREGRA